MAIEPGSERKITLDVALLDHGEHRVAAAVEIRVEPLVVGRKPAFDCAQQEDVEIAVECRIAEGDNIRIGRKGGDAVDPCLRRNKLELRLDDDSGRAPGVKNEPRIVAGERHDARGFLYGHDSEQLDHPGIADDPMANGADARKAACEIASDCGRSHGRGVHHQLLARCQGCLERFENNRPALHANVTALDRDHFVEAGHVEEHTAFERHRLPVVARTTAPQRQ